MSAVTTYGSPSGRTIHLTVAQECLLQKHDVWPKDNQGREYCKISHGLHEGKPTFSDDAALLAWCGVKNAAG